MSAPRKDLRWEGDARGEGVASAEAAVRRLDALRAAAEGPGWVAEEPEIHLWPKLAAAIKADGSRWSAAGHSVDEAGRFVVELEYTHAAGSDRSVLRQDVLGLLGTVIESASYIEISDQDRSETVMVDVVTGMLDDQTSFRSHGHSLRLLVTLSRERGVEAGS